MTFDEWIKTKEGRRIVDSCTVRDAARHAFEAATKAEREACAKVCEDPMDFCYRDAALACANAIKARGTA